MGKHIEKPGVQEFMATQKLLGEYVNQDLAYRLRVLRLTRGMSQAEIVTGTAGLLDQPQLSRLEKGEIANPSLAHIAALALIFDVPLDWLLYADEEQFRNFIDTELQKKDAQPEDAFFGSQLKFIDPPQGKDLTEFLTQALNMNRNILIAGAHGSGKTTLAAALLSRQAGLGTQYIFNVDGDKIWQKAKEHEPGGHDTVIETLSMDQLSTRYMQAAKEPSAKIVIDPLPSLNSKFFHSFIEHLKGDQYAPAQTIALWSLKPKPGISLSKKLFDTLNQYPDFASKFNLLITVEGIEREAGFIAVDCCWIKSQVTLHPVK